MNIGLFPLAAKPYHAGHHAMVEAAASENDKVILFVSTSDRKRKGEFPILGADMTRVWKEEIEKILPGNVEVRYGGSPVRNVYAELEAANNGNTWENYNCGKPKLKNNIQCTGTGRQNRRWTYSQKSD